MFHSIRNLSAVFSISVGTCRILLSKLSHEDGDASNAAVDVFKSHPNSVLCLHSINYLSRQSTPFLDITMLQVNSLLLVLPVEPLETLNKIVLTGSSR